MRQPEARPTPAPGTHKADLPAAQLYTMLRHGRKLDSDEAAERTREALRHLDRRP